MYVVWLCYCSLNQPQLHDQSLCRGSFREHMERALIQSTGKSYMLHVEWGRIWECRQWISPRCDTLWLYLASINPDGKAEPPESLLKFIPESCNSSEQARGDGERAGAPLAPSTVTSCSWRPSFFARIPLPISVWLFPQWDSKLYPIVSLDAWFRFTLCPYKTGNLYDKEKKYGHAR